MLFSLKNISLNFCKLFINNSALRLPIAMEDIAQFIVEYLSCFKISISMYNAANGIMGLKGMLSLKTQKLLTCFLKGLNQLRMQIDIYE